MKLIDLFNSTAATRSTQYANNKVGAFDFNFVPKNHQLYISGLANPSSDHRNSQYKFNILFHQLGYTTIPTKGKLKYPQGYGITLYIDQPTVNNKCAVRCQCEDFYFMWAYYDKTHKSLLGPLKPYHRLTANYPPKNPNQMPGLCKHLLSAIKYLMDNGVILPYQPLITYLGRRL